MKDEDILVSEDLVKVTSLDVLGMLPDPFLFDDGHRVTCPDEWPARRKELYRTVIGLQYGTMPPAPEVMDVETLYVGGWGKANVYKITAGPAGAPVSFRLKLLLPNLRRDASGNVMKPPVIVDGDLCFNYAMNRDWLNAALSEGIAWALFDRTELAHDIQGEGRRKGALYDSYPDCTFGALGAWAWGYSRTVDALEKVGLTDPGNITFTGHSRGGKTAALAGALDERAAIVNPNETCAGSCSCYRLHMTADAPGANPTRSERLHDLWHNFGYWLGPGMEQYADDEASLPFDCHELKAMIAPRTLLISEAASDIWSGPVGSWQTTMAAGEVYRFLGAASELFWYFRPGTHFHTVTDVEMLVSLIKRRRDGTQDHFDSSRFFRLPFAPVPLMFDWTAPGC